MDTVRALAFFDLDGTLLNDQSQIAPETANALSQMKKNGVMPVIATGRTNTEIQHFLENTIISSSITMNGQYAMVENQEVINDKIPVETTHKLFQKTQELGQELAFYTHQQIKISAQTEMAEKCYKYIHQPVPPVNQEDILQNSYNMLLVIGDKHDAVYHEAFPELTFYRNGPYSIDTVSKNKSKGSAVKEILSYLGGKNLPTFGFGDGPNDIELLQACDYKIAMGNGIDSLKEMATYITAKNTEGGIVQALKHYDLI
ncbi:Cof-type HAD-IIB family hydrolase [Vagococcus elongatus]|uniref:HAD family hydrolase n=1 Tax=Vagococcus elongatus TaxID=180344 RepID=A0A430B3W4_9ENTE|nr:Cof-type HAD-IIB family hydrolase [Vagococcus elongatus]RSU15037.1 HAD family hydrolase [Vagococcus elongatus]